MSIICTILFYVCSSHAQTPLNDISGTNTIYSASEVDYRLASRVPTNRTITVGSQVGSLESNLVFASTGTGVTESTVTNIAQAVSSGYLPLSGGTMTGDISMGSNIVDGFKFGRESGQSSSGDSYFACGISSGENATGNGWLALGNSSGIGASGNEWISIGIVSGDGSSGNFWTAIGQNSGRGAIGNSWSSFGNYSAYKARGDGRIYLDSYQSSPNYSDGGATNDMIFGDNGYLYLGRGLGAPGGQQGGTLRGTWAFNDSLTLYGKTITWNSSRQTFDVPLFGGVTGQLFQEQLLLVRNQTGANIANGKIVCSAGAVGDNAAVRLASSADASCAWGVLGMVTQDAGIDHGSNGLICTSGEVNNLPLPTSIYQPSNTLWLTTDGNYTNVEPQNVAVKYQIGIVLRAHALQGRILLNPQYIAPDRITSQSIIRDIVTSTNVVRVTSTQSVYVATVARPCVITQDVSALTLATNQTAFWTTRINITDWSATNGITFATNIAAYAGDFTVTGCYDFACSLLCDGRIEMRQTFPTVYKWGSIGLQSQVNVAVNSPSFGTFAESIAASATNGYIYYIIPSFTDPFIFKPNIWASTVAANTTNAYIYIRTGGSTETSLQGTNIVATICTGNATYKYQPSIYVNGLESQERGGGILRMDIIRRSVVASGNVTIYPGEWRSANELEIKAYKAGWRPK